MVAEPNNLRQERGNFSAIPESVLSISDERRQPEYRTQQPGIEK